MNNFFEKLKNFWYNLTYGAYGNDAFSRFLVKAFVAVIIIYLITGLYIFYFLSLILMIYNIFRVFSKNYNARRNELSAYLFYKSKFDKRFNIYKRIFKERKTHKFFKCPCCKTYVRVPRHRGKIEISCPKCGTKFIKKT